jgi:hypothetical protein
MSDCQYCRSALPRSKSPAAILVDKRLFGLEPPLLSRFYYTPPPDDLSNLVIARVGPYCARYCREDAARWRPLLVGLAADPDADPARLTALAALFEADEEIEALLAENPNTPPPLLRALAYSRFDELLRNPAAPLFLLEAPDLFGELEREFLKQVEKARGCGENCWQWTVSPGWLRRLARSEREEARRYAASHADLPGALAWALADDPCPRVRGYLAYHADEALLDYLASDPEVDVRAEAARAGRHLPVLGDLARDPSSAVRAALAQNRRVELPRWLRWELLREQSTEEGWPPLAAKTYRRSGGGRAPAGQAAREQRWEREFYRRVAAPWSER